MWTLEYKGAVKSLADWKISAARLQFVSQMPDTLQLAFDGTRIDDPDPFDYASPVNLYLDGVRRFAGKIQRPGLDASGRAESKTQLAKNVWWDLEETPFKRVITNYVQVGYSLVPETFYLSEFILNYIDVGATWVHLSTASQISELILYAESRGLDIALGDILPDHASLFPPIKDVSCRSIAELLREELQYHPDATCFFDYSKPKPELNILVPSEIESANRVVNLDIAAPSKYVAGIRLEPLYDKIRPCVDVEIRETASVDGQQKLSVWHEIYPLTATGLETGTWPVFVSLQGPQITNLTGKSFGGSFFVTEEEYFQENMDEPAKQISWWKNKTRYLNLPEVELVAITEISRERQDLYNELLDGQIAPWMTIGGVPIEAAEVQCSCKVHYRKWEQPFYETNPDGTNKLPLTVRANNRLIEEVFAKSEHCKTKATNAPIGPAYYAALGSVEEGDPRPIGLAQYLYNSVKDLKWGGTFTIVEEEPTFRAGLGNLVNLIGGNDARWASMKALVQQCSIDVFTGTTQITVGPPNQLAPETIRVLANIGRRIRRWTHPALLNDSASASPGSLGESTADSDSRPGANSVQSITLTNKTDATKLQQVSLDAPTRQITAQYDANNFLKCRGDQNDSFIRLKRGNDHIWLQLANTTPATDGRWLEILSGGNQFLVQLDPGQNANPTRKIQFESSDVSASDKRTMLIDLDNAAWIASPAKALEVRKVAVCKKNADGSLTNGFMLLLCSEFFTES